MNDQLTEMKLDNLDHRADQLQEEVRALRGEVELLRLVVAEVLDALPDGPVTWGNALLTARQKAGSTRDHDLEDAMLRFGKLLSGEE